MNTPLTTIETETCSRCCGTGKHSFCQMYGDVCFKCKGKGKTLTKRGKVANDYVFALRSKSASELTAGDVVFHEGFCAGPINDPAGWATVESVALDDNGYYTIKTTRTTFAKLQASHKFRMFQNKESAVRTYAAAVAYQATLKADGTPYKRLAKTA